MAGRTERADAARNRRAILLAAERLLSGNGQRDVSVEQVAREAGVGKGTVFHRFGSRAGLMRALVDERVGHLADRIEAGPPPLGPGADPAERLVAFLDAVVALATRNIALMSAYERAEEGERQAAPAYQAWHAHVRALIAEARPGLDAELLAHILLGSLHSDLVVHLLRRGEADRLSATLRDLVRTLLTRGAPPAPPGTAAREG